MKILTAVGLVLVIIALVWQFAIFPAMNKLPADHHKIVYFDGTYKVINAQTRTLDEIPVVITREQQALEVLDNVLIINQEVTATHAESGAELPDYGLTEVIVVERSKREYIPGYGDMDRCGQFSFPEKVEKQNYPMWIPASECPLDATYICEEEFEGLKVLAFEINHQDVDLGIYAAANMTRFMDVSTHMKVEPVSGTTVYTKSITTYKLFPMPDMEVPIFISDIQYTDETLADLVDTAKSARTQLLWAKVYGFWLVIGLGIVLTLAGGLGIILTRPKEAA